MDKLIDSNTIFFPLVSVCIPTKNGERFLNFTLESVLAQDYPNIEVIFSDDNSTDDTLVFIKAFIEKKLIPTRLYHHDCKGIGANWNYCISKAKGKYIKLLMQDDLLLDGCITKMVAKIERNPSVGLVYCRRKILVSEEVDGLEHWLKFCESLHDKLSMPVEEGLVYGRSVLADPKFLNPPRNKIGEPTAVLFPANVLNTVGIFREDLKQTLDYEYWYRILKYFDAYFINEKLVVFRRHQFQETTLNNLDSLKKQEEFSRLWLAYILNFFIYLSIKNKVKLLQIFWKTWIYLLLKKLKNLIYKFF